MRPPVAAATLRVDRRQKEDAMPARAGRLLAVAAAAALVYRVLLRGPTLTWGATDLEAQCWLPGDELVSHPDVISTRAITIDAPPSAVWPWLVQIGSGRGGAYTYDWIENLLGLDMHSAETVLPEFQELRIGDVLFSPSEGPGMRVERLEDEHVLAWCSEDRKSAWLFVLEEQDGGTRLLSRNRISLRGSSLGRRLGMLVIEPGSLVMERKMLLGIKERAERLAREEVLPAAA
jgi:hypothetical protein